MDILSDVNSFFEERLPQDAKRISKNYEGYRQGEKVNIIPLYGDVQPQTEQGRDETLCI